MLNVCTHALAQKAPEAFSQGVVLFLFLGNYILSDI